MTYVILTYLHPIGENRHAASPVADPCAATYIIADLRELSATDRIHLALALVGESLNRLSRLSHSNGHIVEAW
jgi:hypothetical protein